MPGGPALSQPRSAGASLSAAPRGIRTALPSMCVPASALPARVRTVQPTVRSPISVGQARPAAHGAGSIEPRTVAARRRRFGYASGHAVRQAQNYAGRFAGGLVVGTIARWFSSKQGQATERRPPETVHRHRLTLSNFQCALRFIAHYHHKVGVLARLSARPG